MSAPRLVDVVVHTHWDREWYLTREATLARAAAVMEAVLPQLESGQLPSFLFDGQTRLAAFTDGGRNRGTNHHRAQRRLRPQPTDATRHKSRRNGRGRTVFDLRRADASLARNVRPARSAHRA